MKIPNLTIAPDDSNDDAQAWRYFRQRDFTGGENQLLLPESLQPNQLLLAFNCVLTADGLPQTRNGKSYIYTTPLTGAITSVHRYKKEDGSQYLLIQCGTALYSYAYDGSTVFNTPISIATGLNAAKFRSVVWKDKIYLTNGIDVVKSFDGTTFSTLAGSPPKSKVIKVYGNRLYLVDVANPNQIKFSGLETPTTWDALDLINIRTGDGDSITGISPQPGGLVVFKQRTVWALYGTSLSTFRVPESPISATVGAIAIDSILDEGVFVGENNIYSFDLTSVKPIADTHRRTIEAMPLSEKELIFAAYQPNSKQVLIHLGSQVLCLDAQYKGITTWDNLNGKCFCTLNGKNDDGTILIGDEADGTVYKLDASDNDAGTAIKTTIITSYYDYGLIQQKLWRYFAPEVEALGVLVGELQYGFDVDYSKVEGLFKPGSITDGSLVWDTGTWDSGLWSDGTQRVTFKFWFHNALGNRIAFKIQAVDRIRFLGYVTKWREAGAL